MDERINASVRARLGLLGTLFVLTGITGLLTEQIFEKLLSTVVGASTPASSIVLAVYFLGLTCGGLSYRLVVSRSERPLRLYGKLEGFVGVWCLWLWISFAAVLTGSAKVVHLAGDSSFGVFLLRFIIAAAWMLPPTIAMGMSFPAVVGGLGQLGVAHPQRLMSRLYALNLLGAVIGSASGPYLIFPQIGLRPTLLAVFLTTLIVLVSALAIDRGLPPLPRAAGVARERRRPITALIRTVVRHRGGTLLLIVALGSGFLVFSFEVIWIHLIGSVLGNSVYAFAVMLTVTLGGLFVGGTIASSLRRGVATVSPVYLAGAVLASAIVLLAVFGLWDDVPGFLGRHGANLTRFAQGQMLRFACALVLVGLPATVMGVVFPLSFRTPWYPPREADGVAGLLSATNATGCILGSLATGFVILPGVGSEVAYQILTVAMAALGATVAIVEWSHRRQNGIRGTIGVIPLTVALVSLAIVSPLLGSARWDPLALTAGINVYFRLGHVGPSSRLVFWHEDTFGGFTTVVDNPARNSPTTRVLLTNGKFQGNDQGEMPAQITFALIPVLHQPRRDSALVIGLGTGHSAHVVEACGFGRVDVVEISPGIVAAAQNFFPHVNRGVLERPGVALHLEDGRNFLLRTSTSYDLISMEISSIWFQGATNLYSREFYRLVRSRLRPAGVFQQWIQFHHIGPDEVISVISTLGGVFNHVTVWFVGGQAILVASDSPLEIDQAVAHQLPTLPRLRADLDILRVMEGVTVEQLPDRLLIDEWGATAIVRYAKENGIPTNTDGNRYLEYATPRYNLVRRDMVTEVVQTLQTIATTGTENPLVVTSRYDR